MEEKFLVSCNNDAILPIIVSEVKQICPLAKVEILGKSVFISGNYIHDIKFIIGYAQGIRRMLES